MGNKIFQLADLKETKRFGELLASLIRPGDVVGLCGDLGAGKTTLSGYVAHGLGVSETIHVTSPSFTLIKEYQGRIPIYHMDLYRLGDSGEIYELGIWEYYDGEGVCLVEWCDRFDDLWPDHALVLHLELCDGERRTIRARGRARGAELLEALDGVWNG